MIEKQTEYRFVYSNNTLANERKITVNIREASLDEAMKTLLKETGLIYMLKESNLVVIYASKNLQKDIVVSRLIPLSGTRML